MNGQHSPDLTGIYEKLNQMCERGDKLEECLMGNLKEPGLIGMVRQTNDTIMLVKSDVAALKSDVEDLKAVKQRLKGAVAASSALGAGIGWILSHLFKG